MVTVGRCLLPNGALVGVNVGGSAFFVAAAEDNDRLWCFAVEAAAADGFLVDPAVLFPAAAFVLVMDVASAIADGKAFLGFRWILSECSFVFVECVPAFLLAISSSSSSSLLSSDEPKTSTRFFVSFFFLTVLTTWAVEVEGKLSDNVSLQDREGSRRSPCCCCCCVKMATRLAFFFNRRVRLPWTPFWPKKVDPGPTLGGEVS